MSLSPSDTTSMEIYIGNILFGQYLLCDGSEHIVPVAQCTSNQKMPKSSFCHIYVREPFY